MSESIKDFITSPRFLPVVGVVLAASSLYFSAVSLIIRWLSIGEQRQVLQCDSCCDRYCPRFPNLYVQTMVTEGWLVLPGDVHYCPECAKEVEARLIRQQAMRTGCRPPDEGWDAVKKLLQDTNPYTPPISDGSTNSF